MFRVIHHNRWFFWTVGLLIIIGLVLLISLQQAKQEFDDNSAAMLAFENQWRTFRSNTLGLTIKYPPGWQIEIDQNDAHSVYLENARDYNQNIALSVRDPSMEKIIRSTISAVSEDEIVIDGLIGAWLKSGNKKDPATSNVILVTVSDKLYYIAGQARNFHEIVSGIKFNK